MAAGKYKDWLTEDKLTLLRAWARDGLTDEQLAARIGIAPATLYVWKSKYPEFSEALKKGKEIVDVEVENALFKKTQGYNVQLQKTFKVKVTDYDPQSGRKIREHEELRVGFDEVHVPADSTAQFFWLKNRKPARWRDKQGAPPGEAQENNLLQAINESMKNGD